MQNHPRKYCSDRAAIAKFGEALTDLLLVKMNVNDSIPIIDEALRLVGYGDVTEDENEEDELKF